MFKYYDIHVHVVLLKSKNRVEVLFLPLVSFSNRYTRDHNELFAYVYVERDCQAMTRPTIYTSLSFVIIVGGVDDSNSSLHLIYISTTSKRLIPALS